MLDHIADEHIFACEIDRRKNLGEQVPGAADKGPSGLILGRARCLADADEVGVRVAFAGDRVLRCPVEITSLTARSIGRHVEERCEATHGPMKEFTVRRPNFDTR
ncbi:MAG: hypothetical protein NVS1B4_13740 [Gemmatimonadaceae bacterium]